VSQAQWIGPRPAGLQIGILIPARNPGVLAALLAEQHITLAQSKWGAQGDFALPALDGLASGAASLLLPRAA
jgi:hypothetical protein